MKLLGRLNVTALVASFAIGILYTYLVTPPPRVIVKFPSPYNAGKVLYRDKSDACYMFKSDTVACEGGHEPGSKHAVLPQPLLFEGFKKQSYSLGHSFVDASPLV